MTDSTEPTPTAMDRRTFVRRAATTGAAGAMVWAAPSMTTVSRAFGQTLGSPDCGNILELLDDMEQIATPPSAKKDVITSTDKVRIWFEGYGNSGDAPISLPNPNGVQGAKGVLGGTDSIPANTAFAVYLVHAQQPDSSKNGVEQRGGVRFSDTILGVTSTIEGLLATDGYGPTAYDGDLGRRFEATSDTNGDTGVVSGDTVNVVTKQGGFPDQMRVFVACSSPTV